MTTSKLLIAGNDRDFAEGLAESVCNGPARSIFSVLDQSLECPFRVTNRLSQYVAERSALRGEADMIW
jgi:hypothetical protein